MKQQFKKLLSYLIVFAMVFTTAGFECMSFMPSYAQEEDQVVQDDEQNEEATETIVNNQEEIKDEEIKDESVTDEEVKVEENKEEQEEIEIIQEKTEVEEILESEEKLLQLEEKEPVQENKKEEAIKVKEVQKTESITEKKEATVKSSEKATIEINPSEIYPGGELMLKIKAAECANSSSYNLYLVDENNEIVKERNRPVQYAGINFDSEGNGRFTYKGESNKIKFDETSQLNPGVHYLGIADRYDWEVIASEKFTVKEEEPEDKSTAELDKAEVALGESVRVDVHIANWKSVTPQPWPQYDYQVNLYKDGKMIKGLGGGKSEDTDEKGNGSCTFKIPEDIETGEYTININIVRCDTQEIEIPVIVSETKSEEATISINQKVVALDGKLEVNVKAQEYKNYNEGDVYIYILFSDGRTHLNLTRVDFDSEGKGTFRYFDNETIIDLSKKSSVAKRCNVGEDYYIGLVKGVGTDSVVLAKTPIQFIAAGVDKIPPKLTIKGIDNETVKTEEITFTVLAEDDVDGIVEPKVTATSNQTKIELVSEKNGIYTYKATLIEGNNIITIEAADQSENKASKQYFVNYANPENDKIKIIVNGLKDHQEVTEKEISFMVFAKNGRDEKIEDKIVKVNEIEIQEKNNQYTASLKEGANIIELYAKDDKGNKAHETIHITYKKVDLQNPEDLPKISVKGIEDYQVVYNQETISITIDAKDKEGNLLEPKVFVKNGMTLGGGIPTPTENTNPIEEIEKQEDGSYMITFHKDPENEAGINEIKEVMVEATDEQGRKGKISKKVLYNGSGTVVFTETREIIKKDNNDENKDQEITIYIGTKFDNLKDAEYILGIEKLGGGYYWTPGKDGQKPGEGSKQMTKEGKLVNGKAVEKLTILKEIEPGEYWINFYFKEDQSNANINFKVNQETDTIPPVIKTAFRDIGDLKPGDECEVHSNYIIMKATAYDLTDGNVDVTVMLNGEKVERIEPVAYCRYRLDLVEGTNKIVITTKDQAGNSSTVEYTIVNTKDNLNKIKLNKYRVDAGNNLEVLFEMKDYAENETDLILYNCDMDYYHKAPREFYTDQGLPEVYAFQPYKVKAKLDSDGKLHMDYKILENVRSGYYMIECGFGGSIYRTPVFYVAGNEPDIIPPEIYVRGIEDGFVYNDQEVEFSVIANDAREGKVTPVVKVNEKEIQTKEEGNYVANLIDGDNIIEITAKDSKGNISTKTLIIEYVEVDINDQYIIKVREAIKKTGAYLKDHGTYSSDWKVVGIANAGKAVQKDYLEEVAKWAKENNCTSDKVTDYERMALGVSAAGGDARNVGGYNLIDKIYNYDEQGEIYFQGLNGVIYALIAMDTNRYFVPNTATYTREKLVDYVLKKQNSDGGWDLYMSGNSDVDITSMTLISLAPYHNRQDVKDAVEKATNWLSKVQRIDNGGFDSWGSEDNSESVSQTIIGLCANGIDPTNEKFTKKGNTLIDALLSFAQEDGTFLHIQPGAGEVGNTGMATEQAYQALLAYDKFVKMGKNSKEGKASIYYFGEKLADAKGLIMGLDQNDQKISKIYVENLGDKEQDVLLIIGTYDEENRMVRSEKVRDKIQVKENKVIYKEYSVPEGKNYTVKVFLWDSLEGQNPLKAHPITLKVS
ncbi:prenyltransferase/squalene oxidase repeat-containing protein [Inediibacterium massiliense]|uniref:prenyltransferase/squalene oxidase repeat-containing protein n=1 Tax=Inediibacterium massiliense TaxID=1658111 RepID=UPI0006B676C8|nr:prenyltransferase/squalene oxidase repeat-containing protein [Inediibacterium massiliense]